MNAQAQTSDRPVLVKGLAIRSALEWIRRTKGKSVVDAVMASIAEPHRTMLTGAAPLSWYPLGVLSSLFEAYAKSSACTPETLEAQFRQLGTYIAESNLTTLYRVLLAFVKPADYARHIPRLWGEYFKGLTATVEYTSTNSARNITTPLDACKYLSPAVVGWTEFAYRHVGARSITVREKNFSLENPAPRVLEIDLEWT